MLYSTRGRIARVPLPDGEPEFLSVEPGSARQFAAHAVMDGIVVGEDDDLYVFTNDGTILGQYELTSPVGTFYGSYAGQVMFSTLAGDELGAPATDLWLWDVDTLLDEQ